MINFISNCFSKIKRFFSKKDFDEEYAKRLAKREHRKYVYRLCNIDDETDEDYKDNIGEYPVEVDDEYCIEIVLDRDILTKHFYKLNIINTDNYLEVTSLNIPDKYRYKGYYYKIAKIGKHLFSLAMIGHAKLKYINIPTTVVEIGSSAFYCCTSLETIEIPDSVKLIRNMAFGSCDNLKNIKLSSNLKKIDEHTFSRCTSLETIEIPDSVEEIGKSAFVRCCSLKSIKLSKNLKKIGENAFKGIENIILVENNDIIPETEIVLSFDVLKELNKLKIIDTLDKKKLTFVEIPCVYLLNGINYKIISIDEKLFQGYENLKGIKLPEGITKIGAFAFSKCFSLEKIIIPHSVREIEDNAFEYCFSLKIARMSKNLDIIGKDVFKDCSSLVNIVNMPHHERKQDIQIAGKKPWEGIIVD